MKRRIIKILSALAISILLLACHHDNSSDPEDDTAGIIIGTYDDSPTEKNSYTEYIYDAENFIDFKEIHILNEDGFTKDSVELFFYNKDEVNSNIFNNEKFTETLKEVFKIFPDAYDKVSRTGWYISVNSKVVDFELKPRELTVHHVYGNDNADDHPLKNIYAKTYELNQKNDTLSEAIINISFQGYADFNEDKITISKNTDSKKFVCIVFDPSDNGNVSYFTLDDFSRSIKRKNNECPIEEIEYYTGNLSCSFEEIEEEEYAGVLSEIQLKTKPLVSYKNTIPDEAFDEVNNRWYQVNRTVNFYKEDGTLNATQYFLYKMTWDENLFKNYFIQQTEYNTDSSFSEDSITRRVKSVNLVPLSKDFEQAWLYIYGETVQQKNTYSYANYPEIANDKYPFAGQKYVSQISEYRKSRDSLKLDQIGETKATFFQVDGVLHETKIEYVSPGYKDELDSYDYGETPDRKAGRSIIAR